MNFIKPTGFESDKEYINLIYTFNGPKKKKTQDLHIYNEWTEYMYLDSWDEEKLFNTCNLYNKNGWPFTLIHLSY